MAKMCYGHPSHHFVLLLHWANIQCQALIVAVLGDPPCVGNPHRDAAILPSWPAMGLDPLRWDLIMEAFATHTCGRQAGSGMGEGETPCSPRPRELAQRCMVAWNYPLGMSGGWREQSSSGWGRPNRPPAGGTCQQWGCKSAGEGRSWQHLQGLAAAGSGAHPMPGHCSPSPQSFRPGAPAPLHHHHSFQRELFQKGREEGSAVPGTTLSFCFHRFRWPLPSCERLS